MAQQMSQPVQHLILEVAQVNPIEPSELEVLKKQMTKLQKLVTEKITLGPE